MLNRVDSFLAIAAVATLGACAPTGPVYVPTFEPMDATPYMRPPATQQTQLCQNGRIVPHPGPCPL